MSEVYLLRLDNQALENYTKEYFKVYPKRRKAPLDKPFVPSLNKYLIMHKDARNALKERWEEFVYHSCREQGLLNLGLTKCEVEITYVFGDKRKSDLDNRKMRRT